MLSLPEAFNFKCPKCGSKLYTTSTQNLLPHTYYTRFPNSLTNIKNVWCLVECRCKCRWSKVLDLAYERVKAFNINIPVTTVKEADIYCTENPVLAQIGDV